MDMLQRAVNQLLDHQAFRSGQTHGLMGGDAEGGGGHETAAAVIHGVALHDHGFVAHSPCLFEAIFDQFLGDMLSL